MDNNPHHFPNKSRQTELDIARGLAVFFMIAIHVLEVLGASAAMETGLGYVISFLGGPPAAPVFMFLLGVGIVYSAKSTPSRLAKRGAILFLSGYLLNLLRGGLPVFIAMQAGIPGLAYQDMLEQIFTIDILQFAGLVFLFFSAWKALHIHHRWMVLPLLISLLLVNFFLSDSFSSPNGNPYLEALTGLLWGSSPNSYFPLFSWISYPVLGYFFGHGLIRTGDKRHYYKKAFLIGSGLLIIGVLIGPILLEIDIGIYDEYAYYHHGLAATTIFTGFILVWLSMLFITQAQLDWLFGKTLRRWSRNVNSIYYVHWVILGWSLLILEENSLTMIETIFAITLLTVLTDLISAWWSSRRQRKHNKGKPKENIGR